MTTLKLKFKKIILCGFSGAGKSYILNLWKGKKEFSGNYQLIDLDDLVFQELNMLENSFKNKFFSVSENVEKFRRIESRTLENILNSAPNQIISLGGGSLNQTVIDLIKSDPSNLLIFINTSLEDCFKVIQNDPSRYLNQFSSAQLQSLYQERMKFYQQAHLNYSINDLKNIEGPQSFSI